MELSKAMGTMAVVLGVVVAAGFAVGENNVPAPTVKQAAPDKALEEQKRRRDDFERACNRPLKTAMDFDLCRAAYRRLEAKSI